jgi:TetR/AcrR family transcriptional repressor of bet genes
MSRASNTEERRQQIAAAFARVLAQRGYEAASIGETARVAGLPPGLLHYHFANKLEILLAVVDQLFRDHGARLDEALERAAPGKQLDAFIDFHLAAGKRADPERLACWLAVGAEAAREPRVRDAHRLVLAESLVRLEALLREDPRGKKLRAPRRAAAAAAILALVQGYFALAATARELIPSKSAAPSARKMAAALLEMP